MTHHIILPEGNPSNKLKYPHCQVKCLSECSILHWNQLHHRPYIHPFFKVISMTIMDVLHSIRWFTRKNQNWVTVIMAGYFPKIPYPCWKLSGRLRTWPSTPSLTTHHITSCRRSLSLPRTSYSLHVRCISSHMSMCETIILHVLLIRDLPY